MKIRENRSNIYIYAIVCVFYFYIAYQIPYTGDDWDWGLDIGLQHLLTADINSRYAGNLMVVIMTRSKLLQTLIMGAAFFLIPFLMANLAFKRNGQNNSQFAILFVMANILILSMDKRIWQQTYGWISGFANYGISAVLILIYLHLVDPLFSDTVEEKRVPMIGIVGILILGVVMQLFLENLALVMLFLSTVSCLISYLRTKSVDTKYAALLMGNVLGLGILFSSNIYPVLFGEGAAIEGVRSLQFEPASGIIGPIRRCVETFYGEGLATRIWESNLVICIGISVLLIILILLKHDTSFDFRKTTLIVADMLALLYFIVFCYFKRGHFFLNNYGLLKPVKFLANMGFFVLVAIQLVWLYRKQKWVMWKLLLLWVCAPLVILPLSAINVDAGGRFYLTSNCFIILVLLHLMGDGLKSVKEKAEGVLLCVGLAVMLSLSAAYIRDYRIIDNCTQQRMEIIEQAKQTGAGEIELPAYPYPVNAYVWDGDPKLEQRKVYFKEFFGLDPDVRIKLV